VIRPHGESWRIPAESGTDYGVLVKCGTQHHPYWWLLCPSAATLYLDHDGEFDLRDCCNGWECDFLDDVHAKAHLFVKSHRSNRAIIDRIC
jgi:hypothetical protein